jgi:solute carrier family 39 (zinc transporter), member 1/2/3
MDPILQIREHAARSFDVAVECDTGNDYDGRMGVRISSIFVILVGSIIGALTPVVLARSSRLHVPKVSFFIAKYFGTGVIIATAFMHLLSPAESALGSPCLSGVVTKYDWASGICFMTVMLMFTLEILVSHFDVFGDHSHDGDMSDPSVDMLKKPSVSPDSSTHHQQPREDDIEAGAPAQDPVPGLPNDISYPPGGEDHLGHRREHTEDDTNFAAQMTAVFILEFGVIFHSIFIGLTLAVAGEEFVILYIVLVFHQTFEGLGLGSRLATASWPRSKSYMPYLLAGAYAITTPVAIAAGLGVRHYLQPSSATELIVNGIFDAISAGILLYTGLVELMAHEFMFNPQMQKAGLRMKLFALGCIAFGGGLMALLAKWA